MLAIFHKAFAHPPEELNSPASQKQKLPEETLRGFLSLHPDNTFSMGFGHAAVLAYVRPYPPNPLQQLFTCALLLLVSLGISAATMPLIPMPALGEYAGHESGGHGSGSDKTGGRGAYDDAGEGGSGDGSHYTAGGLVRASGYGLSHPNDTLTCWRTIVGCWNTSSLNESSSNGGNMNRNISSSPQYWSEKALCCPLAEQEAQTDNQCYCTIYQFLSQDFADFLNFCNLRGYSLDLYCHGKKKPIATIVGLSAIGAIVLLMMLRICVVKREADKKSITPATSEKYVPEARTEGQLSSQPPAPAPPVAEGGAEKRDDFLKTEFLQFDFEALQAATNNFSEEHKIGEGGFGKVYKGVLRDGQEVAIKRLSKNAKQGVEEFENEVALLPKFQHRNLVKLLGFYLDDVEKLLVYEYVPNKSLDYFLFDPQRRQQLNWSTRYKIIRGVAQGMLYLHQDCPTRVIHRDLKAANILLDADMNPKISDFGTARTFNSESRVMNTNRPVGTHGYIAPEYCLYGEFGIKSDIYSFGVLVLEIVSGKRVINQSGETDEYLVSQAWKCWEEKRPLELIDPTLRVACSEDEIKGCIKLGLSCVQKEISKRPKIESLVRKLDSLRPATTLPMPQRERPVPLRIDLDQSTTAIAAAIVNNPGSK